MHYSNASTSMNFHIYHLIAQCTVPGRRPLDEHKMFRLCFQYQDTVTPAKLYTGKDLVMMETSIADIHKSLYIPEIQNLAFHLPQVRILGNNYCDNTRREAF